MNPHKLMRRLAAVGAVTLVTGLLVGTPAGATESKVEEVASGLHHPRQLAFAPNGSLYVAEAGVRGASTNCSANPPLGTFCLEFNGSLARVESHGKVRRVVTGLPSISSADETIGPFDIAFTGNHKFALTIGLGGSEAFRARFGATERCSAPS